MRAGHALQIALAAWAATAALKAVEASDSNTRPLSPAEDSEVREYGKELSKEWLKEHLAIDLDAIGWRMNRRLSDIAESPFRGREAGGAAGEAGEALNNAARIQAARPGGLATFYAMDLHLEQYDDLRRLQSDLRDIPFAIRFDADSAFFGNRIRVKTAFFMPLSWKDEMRAEARIPVPTPPPWIGDLLHSGGFGSNWTFKNSYSNRLGVSQVVSGLGTQWLTIWNLNYEMRLRFGQGDYEESQWLRLGRNF